MRRQVRRTAWAYTATLVVTLVIAETVVTGWWWFILVYGWVLLVLTLPVALSYSLSVRLLGRKISVIRAAWIVGGVIPVVWFVGMNWPAFGPDYSMAAFLESGLNPTMLIACAVAWAAGVLVARRQRAPRIGDALAR